MNRLVVVSNRVPLPQAAANAGGLAVALHGLMRKRGGLWFGWSGEVSANAATAAPALTTANETSYATVDLTPEEHEHYYNSFSNGVLWPLLHTMPELVAFDRRDAQAYRAVNARFADQLVPLLRPDDLIWIHDYHLLALPSLLRARGVRNPIGFFLHVPFAPADVLAMVPDVTGLARDLLAADLLGFQTDADLENLATLATRTFGASRQGGDCLFSAGRRVRLGVFPVEIDAAEFAATAERGDSTPPTRRLRQSLHGQELILGIDRLDPTKGLPQRLHAMRHLLETRPEFRGRTTLLQIAALSRKEVASYRSLRAELDREAGRLNADWSTPDWQPLRLVATAGARDVVAGYMRAARVGLVTPLRDGMNLVAKEFVAAQNPDDPGVLVLSRFAGAASQLDAALLVNPRDIAGMADALARALVMPLAERRDRWQAMWAAIAPRSSAGWGRAFLAALLRTATNDNHVRPIATTAARHGAISSLRAIQPPLVANYGDRTTMATH